MGGSEWAPPGCAQRADASVPTPAWKSRGQACVPALPSVGCPQVCRRTCPLCVSVPRVPLGTSSFRPGCQLPLLPFPTALVVLPGVLARQTLLLAAQSLQKATGTGSGPANEPSGWAGQDTAPLCGLQAPASNSAVTTQGSALHPTSRGSLRPWQGPPFPTSLCRPEGHWEDRQGWAQGDLNPTKPPGRQRRGPGAVGAVASAPPVQSKPSGSGFAPGRAWVSTRGGQSV